MIEFLIMLFVLFIDIFLLESIIMFAKSLYDDFFPKYEIEYVHLNKDDWEMLKEQTKQYNEEKE